MRYSILIILFFTIALVGFGKAQMPVHSLENKSIAELYKEGVTFTKRQQNDSALMCFTVCGMKYRPDLKKDELEYTIKAMRMQAKLYFFEFYDFEYACNVIAKAKHLSEKHNLQSIYPQILLQQAGIYLTYSMQHPTQEESYRGENLYREAFFKAAEINDVSTMVAAFTNLANRMNRLNRLGEMKKEFEIYKEKMPLDTCSNYKYSNLIYNGLKQVSEGNLKEARKEFLSFVPDDIDPRHQVELYVSTIRTFISEENLDSAIFYEKKILELSRKFNLKDGIAVSLNDLAQLYEAIGDTTTSNKYALEASNCKDSLMNVHHLNQANTMPFLEEMHRLESEAEKKQQINTIITFLAIILGILVVGALLLIITIKRKHKNYINNALNAIEKMESNPLENKDSNKIEDIEKINDEDQLIEKDIPTNTNPKQSKSDLSDDLKQLLLHKIAKVMTPDSDAIYKSGFSIEDLAKIVKSNSRYVSKVINEFYGCNFPTLLSTLRIKHACKLLKDQKNYGNYTLEAIAGLVGFANRTSFNSAFKRVTGKTPKEYRNMNGE